VKIDNYHSIIRTFNLRNLYQSTYGTTYIKRGREDRKT
jgi:hypothetical protein